MCCIIPDVKSFLLVISRRCFSEDGKEMCKNTWRGCNTLFHLQNLFRRRRFAVRLPGHCLVYSVDHELGKIVIFKVRPPWWLCWIVKPFKTANKFTFRERNSIEPFAFQSLLNSITLELSKGAVKYIISTKVSFIWTKWLKSKWICLVTRKGNLYCNRFIT